MPVGYNLDVMSTEKVESDPQYVHRFINRPCQDILRESANVCPFLAARTLWRSTRFATERQASRVQAGEAAAPSPEVQQARAVAEHAQRRAESLQAALDASRRTLCAAGSPSVPPAVAARPQIPARPRSAPLRRPPTAFSLSGPTAVDSGRAPRTAGALSSRSPTARGTTWRSPLAGVSAGTPTAAAAARGQRARPFSAVEFRCVAHGGMHVRWAYPGSNRVTASCVQEPRGEAPPANKVSWNAAVVVHTCMRLHSYLRSIPCKTNDDRTTECRSMSIFAW